MEKSIAEKLETLKKELYLEVASKMFDEDGYDNVTVSDIAEALDISVGTFYKTFETKEKLYFEYILYQLRIFVDKLEENSTEDPLSNLKLFLHYTYEPLIKKSRAMKITLENDPFFFHNLNTNDSQPMDGLYKYLEKQFQAIIKDDTVDSYHIAVLFKKLADGYTESFMIKKFDTKSIIDNTIDLFFNGLSILIKD